MDVIPKITFIRLGNKTNHRLTCPAGKQITGFYVAKHALPLHLVAFGFTEILVIAVFFIYICKLLKPGNRFICLHSLLVIRYSLLVTRPSLLFTLNRLPFFFKIPFTVYRPLSLLKDSTL